MSFAPATRGLARLAWRELRRSPRRTLLVIALVALPVGALTVVAILAASSTANPENHRRAMLGRADAVVLFGGHPVVGIRDPAAAADRDPLAAADRDPVADAVRDLPAGSRVLRVRERGSLVPATDRDVFVQVSDLPLDDPLTAGMTRLLRGRPPSGPGEIAASPVVLRDLGLRLGDSLVSRRLGLRARITAEVLDPSDRASSRVIAGAPLQPTSDLVTRLLVDLPPGASPSAVQRLRGPEVEVFSAADCCPGSPFERATILAISGLALFVMALVVLAAFAIGARRQLRMIGLLSAAAGADERHVRRFAALQGTICGGAGVVAGLALGFGAVAILVARNVDDIANREVVVPVELALVAIMAIAATAAGAWLPGRTAARIPLLAALGGRQPLRTLPATLPLLGLATSAVGTALLATALNDDAPWGLSMTGAVLIVLGFVLCAPSLVAVLAPLAARARGTTRLAIRDVTLQRARTGPLVAAILAVASLALLGAAVIRAEENRDRRAFGIGPDQVLLSTSHLHSAQARRAAVPAQLRARVRGLLPRATEAEIGFHVRRDAAGGSVGARVQPILADGASSAVAIGGPQLLEALGAGGGRAALDRGEVVVLRPGLIEDGRVRIAVPEGPGRVRELRVAASEVRTGRAQRELVVPVMMSTRAAARLGLSPTAADVIFRLPDPVTADERHALQAQAISIDRDVTPRDDAEIRTAGNLTHAQSGGLRVLLAIAAVLTLAVVASGLALSAAEGRADDSVLVALGADPATGRRLRATQAGLLVGLGGLLALPAGLVPAAVILHAGEDLSFAVPWTAVAVVLLALPAAAAAGAWLLAAPGRWSPPVTWAD